MYDDIFIWSLLSQRMKLAKLRLTGKLFYKATLPQAASSSILRNRKVLPSNSAIYAGHIVQNETV